MTGFGTSCGACKFLRRKCTNCCVFAPYFCYDQAATHFAAIHKVYGASNVSRLLSHLPIQNRGDAAITITYEALARMQDPVYGCVAHIYALQQQVASLQEEIDILESLMVNSTFDEVNCGSVQAPMDSHNTIQYHPLQHDAANARTEYYQNQMTNILSHQGSATVHQSFNSQMDTEQLPNVHDKLEESLLDDDSNSINPLEKFLSGIDQEGFMNHPWFKHNADIIRN